MKKIIIAIVAAIAVALPSSAQLNWGIRAGMNVSNLSGTSTFKTENRCGYFLGPQVDFVVKPLGLGFDIAVLYETKNISMNKQTETLNYVDLPINVKYTFGSSNVLSFYLATGPQFSWNLGDESIFTNSYSLKSSQFYWNAGAGFTFCRNFRLGYTYNIPCGYTAKGNNKYPDFKNRTHQFHFTYLF